MSYFDKDKFFDDLTMHGRDDEVIRQIYRVANEVVRIKAPRSTHREDIVQNSVLRIWSAASRGKIRLDRNPLNYMTMICQNEIKRLNGRNMKFWENELNIDQFI